MSFALALKLLFFDDWLKPISTAVHLEAFLLERIPRGDKAVDEDLAHGHESWKVLMAH